MTDDRYGTPWRFYHALVRPHAPTVHQNSSLMPDVQDTLPAPGIYCESEQSTPSARHFFQVCPDPAKVQPPSGSKRQFPPRSEEHTSELQSLMRTSYAVFC